jgi:hypothetical protein
MIFAVFIPPIYYLLNKRIVMFLITSVMFVFALGFAMTGILLPVSIIMWIVTIILAAQDLRKKKMKEAMTMNADILASKIAEKMPRQ